MALYFPKQLHSTRYEALYQRLTAHERMLLLREFVGLTYRRRFLFFKKQHSVAQISPVAAFRRNIEIFAAQQFRHLVISRRVWARRDILRPYLRLIFKHYLFGFHVQGIRRSLERLSLPEQPQSCYYDFFPNLAAMICFNRHASEYESIIESLIDEVILDDQRSLYVYALLCVSVINKFQSFNDMAELAAAQFAKFSQPGKTPAGVELEFSNLGRFATFDKPFKGGLTDPLFQNMHYYEAFFLDDISWRLGGYLDSHIRGRSLLSLPRIWAQPGGFFEYSLVRLDYPRSFSMPLSLDLGLIALYIDEVINFVSEIKPHSLHVNFEKITFGKLKPELEDYLCLLLLGGDLGYNEAGELRELRLANNELRGVIQRRKHRPDKGGMVKEVVEYSYLRLRSAQNRDYSYFPVLMACKGFQYGFDMNLSCRDQVQGMLAWAHDPTALSDVSINRFIGTVKSGWYLEGAHSSKVCEGTAKEIEGLLRRQNQRLYF
ncbi:hypothetical protein KAI46_14875 [bacterium]|nr:hypothetical protein [bacterium]